MLENESGLNKHKEIQRLRHEMQSLLATTKDKKEKKRIEKEYKEKIAAIKSCTRDSDNEQPPELSCDKYLLTQTEVSRAEKRRNRASNNRQDQDKIEKIEFAKTDLSEVENRKLNELLRTHDLNIASISSDGNCLFRSLSHQLSIVYGMEIDYKQLRKLAAEQFSKHRDSYSFFLSDEASCDQYESRLTNSNDYGGELEIKLISDSLDMPIVVYQDTGRSVYNEDQAKKPLQISFHKYLFSECHYNSLVPANTNT